MSLFCKNICESAPPVFLCINRCYTLNWWSGRTLLPQTKKTQKRVGCSYTTGSVFVVWVWAVVCLSGYSQCAPGTM